MFRKLLGSAASAFRRQDAPHFRRVLALGVMTLLVAAAIPSVAAQAKTERPYTFATLNYPGASQTFAMGNNARGDVVGYYALGSQMHAFLWSEGEFTSLDYPGDDTLWTNASAIGPDGIIAGTYALKSGPTGNVHGFIRSAEGAWSNVDYPEGAHLMAGGAFGVLPDGTIVGCVHDGLPATAMYGYSAGPKGASFFEYPAAAPYAMHYGVTPDGRTIVGTYREGGVTPGHWHGYLLQDGEATSFDFPGELGTQALGVNAARDVVGIYRVLSVAGWRAHGYVAKTYGLTDPADWDFTNVDVPGATQTIVRGVNSGGELVGYYFDSTGPHGFVASQGPAAPR